MSGALVAVRENLRDVLTGAVLLGDAEHDATPLPVLDTLPESFDPPCLMIRPADTYIATAGLPYRVAQVAYDVDAIHRVGTAPAMAAGIESLTEQVLDAIFASGNDWTLTQVSAPFDLQTVLGTFPTVRFTVARPVRITTD